MNMEKTVAQKQARTPGYGDMTIQQALAVAGRRTRQQSDHHDRLQRCYAILERAANAGVECPTNESLAEVLGYASPSKPSDLVALLEVMGFITVERSNSGRVVTIVKTGKRTAGLIIKRKPGDWTEDQDAILMDGLAEGEGFTALGKILKKSRSACISRFNKICAQMGVQAA